MAKSSKIIKFCQAQSSNAFLKLRNFVRPSQYQPCQFKSPPIIWVSQYFNTSSLQRQREIDNCFFFNSSLDIISKSFIFSEASALPILPNKCTYDLENISNRCDYTYILEYLNSLCLPDDSVFVLSNSDIFLTSDIYKVCARLHYDECIALTRYEKFSSSLPFLAKYPVIGRHSNTQDTWIFTAKFLKMHSLRTIYPIYLGTPGCENAFSYFLHDQGVKIWNIALDVRTYHNHKSESRNYSEVNRVKGPYAYPIFNSIQSYYSNLYVPPIIDFSYN